MKIYCEECQERGYFGKDIPSEPDDPNPGYKGTELIPCKNCQGKGYLEDKDIDDIIDAYKTLISPSKET